MVMLISTSRNSSETYRAPWIKGWKRHGWCFTCVFRRNIWTTPLEISINKGSTYQSSKVLCFSLLPPLTTNHLSNSCQHCTDLWGTPGDNITAIGKHSINNNYLCCEYMVYLRCNAYLFVSSRVGLPVALHLSEGQVGAIWQAAEEGTWGPFWKCLVWLLFHTGIFTAAWTELQRTCLQVIVQLKSINR